MKRHFVAIIMFLVAGTLLFADTSWIGTGSLGDNSRASVNIGFDYDPTTMHRVSFGFTGDADIDWYGPALDYTNSTFSLTSDLSVKNGAKGYGDLYFYWILRTPEVITAKLYMNGPLHDAVLNRDLDWKITFDSIQQGLFFGNESIDSLYGVQNASTIFSKDADPDSNVSIGTLPVKIETKTIEDGFDYNFTGTISVLIETA